ncbi:cytochrome d ubiquinol oxidase subunit II [Saccharobesus litoralis]|uniref:Cytochrome d ubiquinol oxidase subunit II n=1 Tax=Saccharobesus litoralis TaxID=2172099 RepID=A0A2S0VR94_9ALTE|nr:cytochrome d ubiquinol oxidase subunit II [Saccharobesus litoralis]AWB66600.1 cytochrome d ubiquinol oxidase subunit II [Saccharobesus litoralis]
MFDPDSLALIFAGLTALAVLLYAILDGYDLGVGILLPLATEHDQQADIMIASIGPFWDANETWLVLAVGLLLIAFPSAHNIILQALYIPAAIMLVGLIMRGVAFDFRAKAAFSHKPTWNRVFKAGSILTAFTQGYMLGMYVMGFTTTIEAYLFACLAGVGVIAAYAFIGACWLVMKTEHDLQKQAVRWAQKAGWACFAGVVLVSVVNPIINPDVLNRWFSWPYAMLMLPLPLICFALFVVIEHLLKRMPLANDAMSWMPFAGVVTIFFLSFYGLAFSFYPYVVPGKVTIWQAMSAPESLRFLLYGALVVIPVILAYTAFSYRVFWGKVRELRYY